MSKESFNKISIKRVTCFFVILLLVIPPVMMIQTVEASNDWSEYSEVKTLHLAGSISDLTNYQVPMKIYYGSGVDGMEGTFIKLHCNSMCQSDFDDLRFTTQSDDLLNYWIQTKTDSEYAILWVNVTSIAAKPAITTLYMHYGNPSVVTTSDPLGVFQTFTDFNDTTGITGITYRGTGGTYSVSNSKLTITTGASDNNAYRVYLNTPVSGNFTLVTHWIENTPFNSTTTGWEHNAGAIFWRTDLNPNYLYNCQRDTRSSGTYHTLESVRYNNLYYGADNTVLDSPTSGDISVKRLGDVMYSSIDGGLSWLPVSANCYFLGSSIYASLYVWMGNGYSGSDTFSCDFDYIFIASATEQPPTLSVEYDLGYDAGYDQGWIDGNSTGYVAGWDAALDAVSNFIDSIRTDIGASGSFAALFSEYQAVNSNVSADNNYAHTIAIAVLGAAAVSSVLICFIRARKSS